MSPELAFAELCRQVCNAHNWELLPTGVVVRWGDGRHQLVGLEIFEFEREELVRLSTTIGEMEQLSRDQLTVALKTNAKLAHGALAIKNDQLCMIDTLLISDTGAGELGAAIEYLAREADEYERAIYGTDDH
jgi:hypothetical protein